MVFVQRDERPGRARAGPARWSPAERQFPSEEEGYYPVIVETGLSDAQNVEITSGIGGRDEVFVNYTVTDGSSW
ncbi:MAG: hypothetical protein V8S34_01675 [Lawsonibacter sp.]